MKRENVAYFDEVTHFIESTKFPENIMANLYYYDCNGQKQGPIDVEQLKSLAQQGVVTPETKLEDSQGRTVFAKELTKKVQGLTFLETITSETKQPESTPSEPTVQKPVTESPAAEQDFSTPSETSEPRESTAPTLEPSGTSIQDDSGRSDSLEPASTDEMPISEPTTDVTDRILSELKPILNSLNEKVESLTKEVNFWKQLVERKQADIDKLYDENRDYKDDIIGQFKKKLVLGVIEQLDVAYKQIATFENREQSEKNYTKLLRSFQEIADDFLDMLRNRLGITPFQSNHGEKFDPARHNAIRRKPTNVKSSDTTINESVRNGYVNSDGRILRPEFVEVFYYDASLSSTPSADNAVDPVIEPVEEQNITPLAMQSDTQESKADEQNTTPV